ncbi:MAG TPA: phosphopantetheine-binding protein [Pirellulales bacterium]|nr:phosphopantetheine-binding protein [Pirellulales bacterium]
MTSDEIRSVVIEALCQVAPEADPAQLRPNVSFRSQLDIDSMDFLRFILALHEKIGIEIPEKDYPSLTTLDSCVGYLASADRCPKSSPAP